METGKGVWQVLQDRASDPLDSLFKIRPNERGDPTAVQYPVEREAPSSVRNSFKVGRGEILEPVGQHGNPGICTKSHAIKVFRQQTLATIAAWQAVVPPPLLHARPQPLRPLSSPGP